MNISFESARHQRFAGVAELASFASQVLQESGLVQERGTVTDLPDERTVRYYLAEGLISPAEEKQGTTSIFTYRHLLQLLLIKKLQAEHLPIRKIRELVEGRNEKQLERLLKIGRESQGAEPNAAQRYLETLLSKAKPPAAAPPPPPPARYSSRPDDLMFSAPLPASAPLAPPEPPASTGKWERLEVQPGLELHIRDDFQLPTDQRSLRRLTDVILQYLQRYGHRPRK